MDVFETLIKTAEEKPDHFKVVRVARSVLIKLIPEKWVSDYHLDSYCLHFYRDGKELSTKIWWGVDKLGFIEDCLYPLHELLNAAKNSNTPRPIKFNRHEKIFSVLR